MLIGYITIFLLIGFDQLVKLLSLIFRSDAGSLIKVIIPNVFEFHYIENYGASFGMFQGAQFVFALVTIFSLILFGFLFFDGNFKTKKIYSYGISLIIAGTFGNTVDRLFRGGGVIDMISMPILDKFLDLFGIGDFIFNVADFYMTLGIILFVIDIVFLERKRDDKNDKQAEELITAE